MTEPIDNLTGLAGQYARQAHALTSTIVKELLHYEILYGLSRMALKRHLVFQGGTALRNKQDTHFFMQLTIVGDLSAILWG